MRYAQFADVRINPLKVCSLETQGPTSIRIHTEDGESWTVAGTLDAVEEELRLAAQGFPVGGMPVPGGSEMQ